MERLEHGCNPRRITGRQPTAAVDHEVEILAFGAQRLEPAPRGPNEGVALDPGLDRRQRDDDGAKSRHARAPQRRDQVAV